MRWRDTRTPYDVTVAGLTSKGSAVFYGVDCPMINKPTFYPRYLCLLFYRQPTCRASGTQGTKNSVIFGTISKTISGAIFFYSQTRIRKNLLKKISM